MPEKLKDMFFTDESVNTFADIIKKHYPKFDKKKFLSLVFDAEFKSRELKEKMWHSTRCLQKILPNDYKEAVDILIKIAPEVKGFEAMTLPDFVEQFGQDNWEVSLRALFHFTKYSSSEFAIRPFLIKDPDRVMTELLKLTESEHENVRRFASEGCRPRLPWAMALPKFKKDPNLILPILEKLKDDDSEFVRRSVANNLNDISKDNPQIALEVCEKWYGKSERTNWIVKHACRSMLKSGNKRAMVLFGYLDPSQIKVENLVLDKNMIKIGDNLNYSFQLKVSGNKPSKVRVEYAMDFMKATGKISRKVFMITENTLKSGSHSFKKKHPFIDMSTRKHHEGEHRITIIVNGEEKAKQSFEVKK